MHPAVVLALVSAVAFGLCDFAAGIAARRLSFWWVTAISLVVSAAGCWILVGVQARPPSSPAVAWGLAAGMGAAVGATSLYRGYGRGQMAVAGPLSAIGAAALPVVAGTAFGERLSAVSLTGVALALPAIWLTSSAPVDRDDPRGGRRRAGVVDGLLSGCGFALEFIALERAGDGSGLWPVGVSQTVALALVTALVVVRRPATSGGASSGVAIGALAGLLSLTATATYFLSAHGGTLTIAAVLASLYPAVTIGLAAAFLHERPGARQRAGLGLAAAAVVAIVLG